MPEAPPETAKRSRRARPVGEMVGAVGGVAFKRFGFAQAQLLGRWREIVGPVYARWTMPESLRFPRGQKMGGTLTVRVDGPFAAQLQHVAPQVVERCNRVFGYAAVERLRLVQGVVDQGGAPPERAPAAAPAPPPPSIRAVRDPALHDALAGLAAQLAAGRRPPRIG